MKLKVSILFLLFAGLMSGCGIFRRGCHCPHVSYNTYPQHHISRNS